MPTGDCRESGTETTPELTTDGDPKPAGAPVTLLLGSAGFLPLPLDATYVYVGCGRSAQVAAWAKGSKPTYT